jgi:DNA polymerase-4/DNA polymerase V
MSWGASHPYPRAILHIDGDSFFASCEVARDPHLRGKPVVTGAERGIVSSMTYEAKRLGISRAMPLHEIRRKFPEAVILPSDYETYSLYSHRMYEIVRRYTPSVEEYSIDECFAELTGMRRAHRMSYPKMAEAIRSDLGRELGMTFSMGLSVTKVLAKIGSKWKKPDGLTLIPLQKSRGFLEKTPTGSVWGIGPNTSAYLARYGIRTAYEFTLSDEAWVRATCSKPIVEIWRELRGEAVYEIDDTGRESYQSISKTKTFTPSSHSPVFVFSQLSKNVENACIKARRWGLAAPEIFFFLKSQDFQYRGCEIKLPHATSVPQDILSAVREHFPRIFKRGEEYRATGITLLKLENAADQQLDLFGGVEKTEAITRVYESVDAISRRFGKHAVFLASSHAAMNRRLGEGERGGPSTATPLRFKGESARRRIGVAFLGEVD